MFPSLYAYFTVLQSRESIKIGPNVEHKWELNGSCRKAYNGFFSWISKILATIANEKSFVPKKRFKKNEAFARNDHTHSY